MKNLSFNDFCNYVARELSFYTWRDGAEILILAIALYYFMGWLARDQTKRPLWAFYAYSTLTYITHAAQLYIVSTLLLCASPVFLIALIVIHQHALQKNMISYKKITPAYEQNYAWLDELISACLSSLNRQKEVTCLIEHGDSLKAFMDASYYLHADLKKNILDLFLEYLPLEAAKNMIWINSAGKLIALDVHLKDMKEFFIFDQEISTIPLWQQDALLITGKTDAIVIHASPKTRLFDCVIQGKIIENLAADHALKLIKHHIIKQTPIHEDAYFHAHKNRTLNEHHLS